MPPIRRACARAGAVLALALAWPAVADDREVAANWKRHEMDFTYMGITTFYSCHGLRDKVKQLLLHSGVRPDLKVVARHCETGFGYWRISEFPSIRMVFFTPAIPEPGERELGEPTIGIWRSVTIARNSPRGLEPGDCELVEQFRDRILPELPVRDVADKVNCIPHTLVGNRIDLHFEVLEGIPPDVLHAQSR